MRLIAVSSVIAFVVGSTQPTLAGQPTALVQAAVKEGDALILAAGANGVFENVSASSDGDILLRHLKSGHICRFVVGEAGNAVSVLPGFDRGEGVECRKSDFRATRSWAIYPARNTIHQEVLTAKAEVAAADSTARELLTSEVSVDAPPSKGFRPDGYAIFAVGADADQVKLDTTHWPGDATVPLKGTVVRVDILANKAWLLKLRSSGDAESLAGRFGWATLRSLGGQDLMASGLVEFGRLGADQAIGADDNLLDP